MKDYTILINDRCGDGANWRFDRLQNESQPSAPIKQESDREPSQMEVYDQDGPIANQQQETNVPVSHYTNIKLANNNGLFYSNKFY